MHIKWLREQTQAFADTVQGLDFDTRVTTCPEWPVRVLVAHIGQSHRWSAEIARAGAPTGFPDPLDVVLPEDWTTWLIEGAEELIEAVQGNDAPVWSIGGTGPASFWLRRMTHDTAVHYVDAAITAGVDYEIAEDLAVDGILEGLELLASAEILERNPAVAELCGNGQTLRISPSDHPGWLITRTPHGVTWRHGTGEADVTVSGTAQDLLLTVYGRLPLDEVVVSGKRELFVHWLEHTRF
jgi:uncharacterized protein (TIGR03083 family)